MRLATALQLFAGGPGSGCKGDNCGRPSKGAWERMPKGVHTAAGVKALVEHLKKKVPGVDIRVAGSLGGRKTESKNDMDIAFRSDFDSVGDVIDQVQQAGFELENPMEEIEFGVHHAQFKNATGHKLDVWWWPDDIPDDVWEKGRLNL